MKAHLAYWRYILRHKYFVFKAGRKTKTPIWRLIIHDWSKFLPQEWFAYLRYFHYPKPIPSYGDPRNYGGLSPQECEEILDKRNRAFDEAWLHHIHLNAHHWQHWVLREDEGGVKCLPMPLHFAREMVADWAGAGRAITGTWEVAKWYTKNRQKIQLHPNTRLYVENLLAIHFDYVPTYSLEPEVVVL